MARVNTSCPGSDEYSQTSDRPDLTSHGEASPDAVKCRADAHILRNAGGVVTDDVIRSLTISQRLLDTTDVMVIMHAACGLRDITDEQFTAAVHADIGLRPTWRVGTFRDVTAEARRGVARLRNTPFLCHTNSIRGFCFDETTGELQELC